MQPQTTYSFSPLWLFSLNIIILKLIHGIACINSSIFFKLLSSSQVWWLIPVIPATLEAEIDWEDCGLRQVWSKGIKTPSQPIKAEYGSTCLKFQLCGIHKYKDCIPGWPGHKMWEPVSKINKAKRARDMDQVVEHLHSKSKFLSSNSWTAKQTKE
jgi:hypothetical protein